MTNRMDPRIAPWTGALALALLATTVACSDDPEETPPPTPGFQPSPLEFGRVSVVEERTLDLVISNTGGRPYLVTSDLLVGDEEKFIVGDLPGVLTTSPGLGIGQTATVSVTFRPCAAALADPSAIEGCDLAGQDATLQFVDNTQAGNSEVSLGGVATLPPNLSVRCWATCGEPDTMTRCVALNFSGVPVGGSCEIQVELTNSDVEGNPAADALVESIGIQVVDQGSVGGTVLAGEEAGFSIQTTDGQPLAPSFTDPLRVAIPAGQSEATETFSVIFSPEANGTFNGLKDNGNGFTITYNDPSEPSLEFSVIASGTGPRFQVVNETPNGNFAVESGQTIQFRGITAGETAESTLRLSNTGDASMTVGPITLEVGDPEFALAYADTGEAIGDTVTLDNLGDFDRELMVTYTPTDDDPDTDTILISCSTPACEPAFEVNLAGGALPLLEVRPPSLAFSTLASSVECKDVDLANTGDAQLVVDRFEFVPASSDEESLDDFYVDLPECGPGAVDCTVDLRIDAPEPDEDANAETISVCYLNNDSSKRDAANLEISSNDPSALGGVRSLSLIAEDSPCLAPVIGATVDPEPVCVGQTATLDLTQTAEDPGGPSGVGGVLSQCTIEVDFGTEFPFMPNPVTANDGWQTEFIVPNQGPRILGITCINNCGAQQRGQVNFLVNVCN